MQTTSSPLSPIYIMPRLLGSFDENNTLYRHLFGKCQKFHLVSSISFPTSTTSSLQGTASPISLANLLAQTRTFHSPLVAFHRRTISLCTTYGPTYLYVLRLTQLVHLPTPKVPVRGSTLNLEILCESQYLEAYTTDYVPFGCRVTRCTNDNVCNGHLREENGSSTHVQHNHSNINRDAVGSQLISITIRLMYFCLVEHDFHVRPIDRLIKGNDNVRHVYNLIYYLLSDLFTIYLFLN